MMQFVKYDNVSLSKRKKAPIRGFFYRCFKRFSFILYTSSKLLSSRQK